MRNTLLATTALVLSAGIASADGHASLTWKGTATAGLAREGSEAATKATAAGAEGFAYQTWVDNREALQDFNDEDFTFAADSSAVTCEEQSDERARIKSEYDMLSNAGSATANAAMLADYNADVAALDYVLGVCPAPKEKAGNWESYSEVNATVTGSVTAGDVTMTASVSVDAGKGYDFATDDGFDSAKTNGVSLDNVTVATSMGTFKIDEDAIAHLVDGDDDGAADVLYTNTFGSASVSVAVDLNKDSDDPFKAATAASVTSSGLYIAGTDATAQDVAWSAKVSMPLGGGSAYVAMDEEGGNIFGASASLSGIGLTFSSKLEALESENKADRINTIGATYIMGATTLGASWDSADDGDQWGISAAYAGDGMTVSASTDEGSDWSVSGSFELGTGASLVGGVNYTEDAYLGLSFSF